MAEINPLTTRKMLTPDEYNVKSSLNNETQQSAHLQQYIRNELDKALPVIFANLPINTTKVISSDEIYQISKSEQATCLQVSKANLEHELKQYSISEDLRKQIFSYLETQIFNRFRSWNTSSILAAERNKLTVMIRNRESELQEYLHEISAQTDSSDRTSVIEIFENIWNDHISPMKKLFNTETEWTQIIQLIFEVYQGFNNDTKSSFDDIIYYLPFLISQTPFETKVSLDKILIQIRNECVSKMLDENPVVWRSNYFGYKTFDSKVLTHFHYIDGEKLNDIWLRMNSDSSIENNYQQFCQKIFREWSLFIPVAFYFEV